MLSRLARLAVNPTRRVLGSQPVGPSLRRLSTASNGYRVLGDRQVVPLVSERTGVIQSTLKNCGLLPPFQTMTGPLNILNDKAQKADDITATTGVKASGSPYDVIDPTTNMPLTTIQEMTWSDIDTALDLAVDDQQRWAALSGTKRLAIIGEMVAALKEKRDDLATLLTLEVGKIKTESHGELNEVFDLYETLKDLTKESGGDHTHRMDHGESFEPKRREQGYTRLTHHKPYGLVMKVTAFNFPYAVFGWGALPALAAGNGVVLKPHEQAVLTSKAMVQIMAEVGQKHGFNHIVTLVPTDREQTQSLWKDPRISYIEATGSEQMGQALVADVGPLFKPYNLELGGNNAVVVHKDAHVENAVESCVFAAAGTAGQRCTTLRRIFVHDSVYDQFETQLVSAYKAQLKIGDPLMNEVNVGPLFNPDSVHQFIRSVRELEQHGGQVLCGGGYLGGNFVEPALIRSPQLRNRLTYDEQFVPRTVLFRYQELEDAVREINAPGYGLSGAVFTADPSVYQELAAQIRTGIFHHNYGPSGNEHVGYFGGIDRTGGGKMLGPNPLEHYQYITESLVAPAATKPLHAQGVEF